MEHQLSAQRVWDDIEFELAQGLPSQDALGRGIRAAQQQQDALRGQVFGKGGRLGDQREILARQFQTNEMLLALLQETATALRKVQLDVERISRAPQAAPFPTMSTEATAFAPGAASTTAESLPNAAQSGDSSGHQGGAPRPLTDLDLGMRPDALELSMPRESPAGQPVVGGLILRVKRALHRLVLFHVRSLSEKQTAINRTYGEWIRYQVGLAERQNEKLLGLNRRIAAIEAHTGPKSNPS